MKTEIHDFQMSILRTLLFRPGAHFSELNKVDVTSDHFNFHIKKLIEDGLIIKKDKGYFLTIEGKKFAGKIDTDTLKVEKQAKISVAMHAVREVDGERQYLIHHRLKEPFFGWYGSHSGKVHWGETTEEAARREFFEEAGLNGDFTLKGIVHCRDYDKDGNLLDEKFIWVYRVDNVVGEMREKVEEGENIWMTEKEYRQLKNTFADFEEMEKMVENKQLTFSNRERVVEGF